MKTAYFDCFSGASGDMILGALVDAGLDLDVLRKQLGLLKLKGYTMSQEKVSR
ncbi:MAG: LarC family nickel insertion protein, partial [Planctomycetes bacterium]|nr:LarC family nickel insertion protein [Planctomycetota bacterium]